MAHLPSTGDSNWGVPLNSYITTVVLAQANAAAASIASHAAASDPHGDRAYALGLVAPLTTGVNGPNGFLQLNNIGKIPNGVLPPGGGRTSSFDAVKDYSAPVNGTSASTQIQNALNDAGTAGGGEVWVGDGTYGIDTTLYVPSGVWLHLSPGAVMNRIVNTGSGLAPVYMVANFNGSVSGSGSSNILIEGGKWVFDSQAAAGVPMAFVDGDSILVRNTNIRALAQSPAVLIAGCTNVACDEVQFSSATPGGARSAYTSSPPAVRIEVAGSGVIAGLNAGMYTNAACTSVRIRNCTITGATASDGTGVYTIFNGLAGTTAATASVFHQNIIVSGNMSVGFPANAVNAVNWQTMGVTGNQFSLNNGQDAVSTWNPSAPGSTNQVIANNLTTSAGTDLKAYKTGNTSRTGTTMSNDPDLQVTVSSSAVYQVVLSVPYACAGSITALKYDFSVPSGATFTYTTTRQQSVSTGFGSIDVSETISNTNGTSDNADPNGTGMQVIGLLQVSTTGGTFAMKWAQQSNQPSWAVTVQQGSVMFLKRLA
jgi:hypothetical protein